MNGEAWLVDVSTHYRSYKQMCERAAKQLSDEQLFVPLEKNPNSVAVVLKHVGSNLRSRWRDFLTTDGEKKDRRREAEFSVESDDAASVWKAWEDGWAIAFENLESLTESDLDRTVTIRGEPHGVVQAIHRNLNHVVFHSGQIVQMAKALTGDAWQPQSIPPGQSDAYNAKMREKYGDWTAKESSD